MCSIAGMIHLKGENIANGQRRLSVMNDLQAHRGPDGEGTWLHTNGHVGFAHRRLSIIGLTTGAQPMKDAGGNWVCFNGEIYNYLELRDELDVSFHTDSDTEVILAAWRRWGEDCVKHFDGMFAFALWDEKLGKLFCARDRFGIKPFYYTIQDDVFYFASEMKALLPFLQKVETDLDGFKDYLFFQFCLHGKTMFRHIQELRPAHILRVVDGKTDVVRYWQVYYRLDLSHTEHYFEEALRDGFSRSVKQHIRSDVPVGGYVSGGVDSSIISSLASGILDSEYMGFTGKFDFGPKYDESYYAELLARRSGFPLQQIVIGPQDFTENIEKIIYHLDCPVAGPGSFSQYMVSQLASHHRKVVLGGQGGDEIFGGYTRYLVAYLEQCLKGAIDDTAEKGPYGRYIVTMESIIPNLTALQQYKPMLKNFFSRGLFDESDRRYYSLVNRAPNIGNCVYWDRLGAYDPYQSYQQLFNAKNVEVESYLDRMTHFDFKTLLPALLQVEDRMSMAHGIESRVPFLDHRLVELVASIPAMMKFKGGQMKYILRHAMRETIPLEIMNRTDKMGFPTPFTEWAKVDTKDYILDILMSYRARNRDLIDNMAVVETIEKEGNYSRNLWGMFCLELWQRQFHDQESYFNNMVN